MVLAFFEPSVFTAIITGLAALAVAVLQLLWARARASLLAESKQKIAEAEVKVEQSPEKVKPAWDLARATLEAYFNRNLSQIASIFWLSVVVMFLGFSVLVYGVINAINHPEQIKPSTIAALGGIITEFIGATFLFIYRSTIQQAVNYSKTLERINSVGMAMQILDTMPDEASETNLKSRTKATIVELLIRQAYELKPEPPTKTAKPAKATRTTVTKSDSNP